MPIKTLMPMTYPGPRSAATGVSSVNVAVPRIPRPRNHFPPNFLASRQRYVLGDSAMQQMAQSHVFLSGMGGLGVEMAKNIVLAGVKAVTVHDTKKCETWDLGTNFFIHEDDVLNRRKRVETVYPRIAELNPYVQVNISTASIDTTTDLSFLKQYQFISTDVYGICSRVFCDFGEQFEVSDPTGEEPKEIFVQNITQSNPGVVTCMDNRNHGLQSGQLVTFREVNGMSELNGTTRQITALSPYTFSIGDTSHLEAYTHGGIIVQIKSSKTFCFEKLEKQLSDPSCLIVDFSKPEAPLQIHAALLAMDMFQEQHQRMPAIGCLQDAELLLKLTKEVNTTLVNKADVNEDLVKWVSRTAKGSLPPLAAAVGGIASQEVLKALTGKFAPLQQWFYFDALEVVKALETTTCEEFFPRGDRYDALRACIGETMCQKLHQLKVFIVGCGAIGCEMLKNFALLGVGLGSSSGMIAVTDPDLIEKSNLNRQFLFRPHHIQVANICSKMACNTRLLKSVAYMLLVHSMKMVHHDFSADVIELKINNKVHVNLAWCRSVSNQRPLLDSGTMGTKGHTEVIVPNLTESYNSHRDPPEEEIPFCTLKSFPAVIEHTIQWARDKFESSFTHKPSIYNKFWQIYSSAEEVLQRMQSRESLEGSFQVVKLLSRRPTHWSQCVTLARLKFEKYFKRKDLSHETIFQIVSDVKIPEYKPSEKKIETDESARKPDQTKLAVSSEEEREAISQLEKAIAAAAVTKDHLQMTPVSFEKDDDRNGHIDFITAASNLRARMYNIEAADRLKTKRIAGKIIPAIATSTAAVSGLVGLELIKVVGGCSFDSFKNCFFNLAIPIIVFTETAEVKRTQIRYEQKRLESS
ncbi:Ubiquitin-like modifier-activating enzyme 6 [Acipenser ruthenus]|uniref:Ubiquitin-like modifier-activating enzyme 6 n=1 Tax=Acipenser ruthenus TaxID=7906 RepID=A0A444UNT0_ACIRT|nr:Ubiquitin-like modifier-activating enzyme 6 [Acipenser ruthenus]